jgi:sulfoxide reductase heme-binding subunit YedZ
MSPGLASIGPSAYWYLTRGTGTVTLILLTISVILGILGPLRVAAPRWPRFAIDTVHRDVSLLVLVLLVIHIVTSVLDGFAPISLTASVIPFISPYRPFWLGLGALAFDILIALVVTSLARRRLGYGPWRVIHWLAYASFPFAVLHGLGTGTDTKLWWMLLLTAACVAAVTVATCVRVARSGEAGAGVRTPALLLALLAPVALALFTVLGPLAPHWAKRSGTPAHLLAGKTVRVVRTAPASASTGLNAFNARLAGSVHQFSAAGGAIVDLNLHLSGGASGRLRIRLGGEPSSGGGGLTMTGSQVDLATPGTPVLAGHVTQLAGTELAARLFSRAGRMDIQVRLNIDSQAGSATGRLDARPA